MPEKMPTKSTSRFKWLGMLITIMLIAASFWLFEGNIHKGLYVLIRTIVVLICFVFILNPIFRWALKTYSKKLSKQHVFALINEQIEAMAAQTNFLWKQSAQKTNPVLRTWYFMELMLAISLYPNHAN
jgi:hypothetical protein